MHRVAWTLGMLLLTTAATAQSLAELARQEKERREKLEAEEVPTYTELDLANPEGPLTQVTGVTLADDEGDGGTASQNDTAAAGVEPARDESSWRDRLSALDERIRDLEEKLQSPLYTLNPRGAVDRQRLESQLEQAREEREAFMTEARRAGVPPGWLRQREPR